MFRYLESVIVKRFSNKIKIFFKKKLFPSASWNSNKGAKNNTSEGSITKDTCNALRWFDLYMNGIKVSSVSFSQLQFNDTNYKVQTKPII